MQTEKIESLYKTEYRLRFLNVLRQYWKDEKEFSCVGEPKKQHLLLYLKDMCATYVDKSGRVYEAKSGDVVYTPEGAEYQVGFHSFTSNLACTVGVNFQLRNEQGEDCRLSPDVKIFSHTHSEPLFFQAEKLSFFPVFIPNEQNALLYQIFSVLGKQAEKVNQNANFKLIEKGILFLNEHLEENVSIEELANLCHISTVYFRKLFKRYVGSTPAEYKIKHRMERAERHLRYGEQSISEIAESLGYIDVAYFIKQFKKTYSVSPLAYRFSLQNG